MTTIKQIEIRRLPLAQLTPAPYNPRKVLRPSDPAYKKLSASLREFGLVEPLVWNELTGHVVGGHARLAILQELGAEDATVSVVRLTPEREKALNIVLNNREAQGRFDSVRLTDILSELESLPELALTGFDQSDLRAFRLEPIETSVEELPSSRVEVILSADRSRYDELATRLDDLVAEFDLECHVRGL